MVQFEISGVNKFIFDKYLGCSFLQRTSFDDICECRILLYRYFSLTCGLIDKLVINLERECDFTQIFTEWGRHFVVKIFVSFWIKSKEKILFCTNETMFIMFIETVFHHCTNHVTMTTRTCGRLILKLCISWKRCLIAVKTRYPNMSNKLEGLNVSLYGTLQNILNNMDSIIQETIITLSMYWRSALCTQALGQMSDQNSSK